MTDWEFARGPGFARKQIATEVESMALTNGVVVEDPRDFISVVERDSVTAREAKAWIVARHRWGLFGSIVLSSLAVGPAVLILAPTIAHAAGATYDVTYALVIGGLISAIVTPVLGLITSWAQPTRTDSPRSRTIRTT